jgi:hypothetical protein
MRVFKLVALVLPLAMLVTACEGDLADIPTTPDPVTVTETFSGTLTVNGAATHVFFTTATGAVTATLTSLGDEPPTAVGMSLGTYSTTQVCSTVLSRDNAVVTTVVEGTVTTLGGSLCVRIYDVGSLAKPVPYEIRVSHK